jgi:hypothetical protein
MPSFPFYGLTVGGGLFEGDEYTKALETFQAKRALNIPSISIYLENPKTILASPNGEKIFMNYLNLILLLGIIGVLLAYKDWRKCLLLLIIYAYFIFGISVVKQIEPRNVAANLALLSCGAGFTLEFIIQLLLKIKLLFSKLVAETEVNVELPPAEEVNKLVDKEPSVTH